MKRNERAAKLEAEAKALRREEKAFWQEAESRKEELLNAWNIPDTLQQNDTRWKNAAEAYGIDEDALYAYVMSERQISYFRNHRSSH